MNTDLATKVRPIYSSLIGFLDACPDIKMSYNLHSQTFWEQLNSTVDDLVNITSNDYYTRFKIFPKSLHGESLNIPVNEYRSLLSGLINYIKGEFFYDEQPPGNGIVFNNTQNQTVQLSILLEVQGAIDKKLYSEKLDIEEKSFLEKVKSSLPSVKTSIELINLILSIAKSTGIDLSKLINLFAQ